MERTPKVGDPVVWVDSQGMPHPALVTAAWSQTCINVVFVSGDETKRDDYGRQIERQTSAVHASLQRTHGFYWRWPDEPSNPYTPPASV